VRSYLTRQSHEDSCNDCELEHDEVFGLLLGNSGSQDTVDCHRRMLMSMMVTITEEQLERKEDDGILNMLWRLPDKSNNLVSILHLWPGYSASCMTGAD
jgi:hypothetical protein